MKTPALLALFLTTSAVLATTTPTQFPLCRQLNPPTSPTRNEIGAVTLDAAIFNVMDGRFGNIRIFDQTNREVPFLIRHKAPPKIIQQLVPSGLPVSFDSLRQLDGNRIEIVVTRQNATTSPVAIQFESGVRNFEKLVTVRGSLGGEKWTVLAKDEPIYDYSRFADVRRDQVRITPGRYALYKIEISNITEKKDSPLVEVIRQTRGNREANEVEATSFLKEPFRVNQIVFLDQRETVLTGSPETRDVPITATQVTEDAKKQETSILFTTQRQPISAIMLQTDDTNFSRGITVEGETEVEPKTWQNISGGQLSRLHAGRIQQDHLTLTLPCETRYRRYRLTIHNRDNPPLAALVIRVRESLHEAVFFPKAGAAYRFCYGGAPLDPPVYDVATVLAEIPAGTTESWTMSSAGPQAAYSEKTTKAPFPAKRILTIALIVMAGVLIIFIARLARKVEVD